MSKKQQVNFRIDTDLLEALKQQAEVEGISYTDLIQRFCRQGFQKMYSDSLQPAIQPAIQSSDSTIQPAIQPDLLKEQLKAELLDELGASINELFKVNMEPIKEREQALMGE